MTITVNIHAAKTQLSRLLEQVEEGEEIVIARAGKPIARIVPLEPRKPKRRLGILEGQTTVPETSTSAARRRHRRFYKPLSDDEFGTPALRRPPSPQPSPPTPGGEGAVLPPPLAGEGRGEGAGFAAETSAERHR
jgi:prevent-host-death family protein